VIVVADRVVLIVGLCTPPLMTTDTTVVVLMALLVPPVPVKVTLYLPAVVPEIVTLTLPEPP
jgi:hypothetical protein